MNNTLLYQVEDKPRFSLSLLLAFQHLLAALGGIIAVPLVIGSVLNLPSHDTVTLVNAALLISGVVTIIQCLGLGPIGIRLPIVMGTSFTFVAAALAVGYNPNGPADISGILGASLVGSLVMIIGSFFMPQIRKLFPPVVTGTVVTMIGLSLIPVGIDWFAGGQPGSTTYASLSNIGLASFVLILVIILVQFGRGIFASAAIIIGMMVGYLFALFLEIGLGLNLGLINFTPLKEATSFAVPQPLHFGLSFPLSGIIGMSIAYLVTIVESSGNFLAVGKATKTSITGKHMKGGILCDGLGSALAALMSTTPFSAFAQNIGVISLTGVASRYIVALTGALLIIAGLFPLVGALIFTIPLPVLGGAGLMMFAMIAAAGIEMLGQVEPTKRNSLIIAVSIGLGLMVTMRPEIVNQLPSFFQEILKSGITVGALLALGLNFVLPGRTLVIED